MAQFPNYLKSNRKRLGLSQGDVAFLLGMQQGGQVCRHERFTRAPSLEVALAYEAILQRSACELFNGLYQQVEQQVAVRAKALIEGGRPSRQNTLRSQLLTNLASKSLN
jgi:transcriptional regulator with XRE-family HTH domain